MQVEQLYRFPVKGLNPEALEEVTVVPGEPFPWDRAFALAQGDADFDPAAPRFLPKSNFMCLLKNERAASLRAQWDPHDRTLTITRPDGGRVSASPFEPAGRDELGAFLTEFLGDEARGTPRFHHVPGHWFADNRVPLVSLLSLNTLRQFEAEVGAPREPLRFRCNVQFGGGVPWAEFDWIDKTVEIGTATLRVTKRLRRCNATQVNPATAQRDADPVRELMGHYGHPDLGVLAEVLAPGRIAVGDTVRILSD